jgi:hypothetical protein
MKWLKALGIWLIWWIAIGTALAIVVALLTGGSMVTEDLGADQLAVFFAFVAGGVHAVWYLVTQHRKERDAAVPETQNPRTS